MNDQVATQQNVAGQVIVTVDGHDIPLTQESLGLSMDSTEQQILDAVQGVIQENLRDPQNEYAFCARKYVAQGLIVVVPKPVAGV